MSITQQQAKKLETGRRTRRPKYYTATTGEYVEISFDTENFLLLMPPEANLRAQLYLDNFVNVDSFTNDYNDLLQEALFNREARLKRVKDRLNDRLGKYNEMVQQMRKAEDPQYDYASGAQPLFNVLNQGLKLFTDLQEQYNYYAQFRDAIETEFVRSLNDEYKKECRSWIRVLASY